MTDDMTEMTAVWPQQTGQETGRELRPLWITAVLGIAGAMVAVELAVFARYGIHRDELYFLACARHMAWGYVDQAPLVAVVAWLSSHVAGSSAVALRTL